MSEAVASALHDVDVPRRIARVVAFALFAAFTVWINYEVKFALRPVAGTVEAIGALRVGAPAPDFSVPDLDGAVVSLASMQPRKTVLIEFWATWCPPCRMVLATLRRMQDTLREHDVEVLSVNQAESPSQVRSFVDSEGMPFHVLIDADGSVAQRYQVTSLPTMLLIDRRGTIRWIHVGHMPETDELRDVIERVAKE